MKRQKFKKSTALNEIHVESNIIKKNHNKLNIFFINFYFSSNSI